MSDLSTFQNHMQPLIDDTVNKLVKKRFEEDPLLPGEYSKIASIVSSAYKRHGFILEQAILYRLSQNNNLVVWDDPKFGVSASAESLVSTFIDREGDALDTDLPYLENSDDHVRTIQVDVLVYNKTDRSLTAYEIKRGNGLHDAGKRRSMKRDLLIQQTLLKSYGTKRNFDVSRVDSKIIFYYGQCSLPKPFSLTGDEIDTEFKCSIRDFVEEANIMLAKRLTDEIDALLAPKKEMPERSSSDNLISEIQTHVVKQDHTTALSKKPHFFARLFSPYVKK